MSLSLVLVGYAGHAHVVGESWLATGQSLEGYCEWEEKTANPFSIPWLGDERTASTQEKLSSCWVFASMGNNAQRSIVHHLLQDIARGWVTVQHPSAVVSPSAQIEAGVYLGPSCVVNAGACIGRGSIINSGCIIEHGTCIGEFSHIAPGAVLCGDVQVGPMAFIGAASVVRESVLIGAEAFLGAGSVVHKNVPAKARMVGNPIRPLP